MKDQNNLPPPLITEFYDDQERELYELVEGESFLPDEISEKRKLTMQYHINLDEELLKEGRRIAGLETV